MTDEPLTHNVSNAVTAGIWRRGNAVHKLLSGRRVAPAHWVSSDQPTHWNYWRREALVYSTGLPQRLGLGAPRLLGLIERDDGDLELVLEHIPGASGADLTVADLEATALALGRAQGDATAAHEPWLSRGFLRAYSGSRPADWRLLAGDAAWAQPLMREYFPPALRAALVGLRRNRERLLAVMEALPRAVCHLDVWPPNVLRRDDGSIALIDWAFAGDGALGEDIGNLVPDSVFDLLFSHELLDELDQRLTGAYLDGLREAGWRGDERLVRLGICASAVKYDWLTPFTLEHAGDAEHPDYGHDRAVDAHARYRARAAGLALLARWAEEAEQLARALNFSQRL